MFECFRGENFKIQVFDLVPESAGSNVDLARNRVLIAVEAGFSRASIFERLQFWQHFDTLFSDHDRLEPRMH